MFEKLWFSQCLFVILSLNKILIKHYYEYVWIVRLYESTSILEEILIVDFHSEDFLVLLCDDKQRFEFLSVFIFPVQYSGHFFFSLVTGTGNVVSFLCKHWNHPNIFSNVEDLFRFFTWEQDEEGWNKAVCNSEIILLHTIL